jgi:hypothetical protein
MTAESCANCLYSRSDNDGECDAVRSLSHCRRTNVSHCTLKVFGRGFRRRSGASSTKNCLSPNRRHRAAGTLGPLPCRDT